MRSPVRHSLQLLCLTAAMTSGAAFSAEGYGVLKYGDGKTFQTGVFQPRYIGQLPTKNKAPYLVFSGRSCNECDANRTIYIHSPDDGPMLGGERDPRYGYPGQYHHYETQQLVHTARVFLGNCFTSPDPVVLWFARDRTDSGKWQQSVFVAEIVDDRLVSRLMNDAPPKLVHVIANVKKGSCRELKGGKGYIEP